MQVVQEIDKNNADYQVITMGSTWSAIWQVSWPLFLNMMTIALVCFSEIYIAGRLGYESQAAIGFSFQIWNLMMLLATAMAAASTALVSRFWGAGDREQAIEAARQSLLFAVLFGTCTTVIGLLCSEPILSALGATQTVKTLALENLRISMLAQIGWNIIWIGNSIFRAKGNTRVPMYTWLFLMVVLIAMDWVFAIYPFHFGVAGLAWSGLIGSTMGAALNLYKLRRSDIGACVSLSGNLNIEKCRFWLARLLRIGLPACIQDVAWLVGNFFFLYIFAQTEHAAACQAAYAVGFRIEDIFGGMPIYALNMGAATIVGQNLGANQPKRAERAGWHIAGIGFLYDLIVGIALFVLARPIATLMTPGDSPVIGYATQYFQVVGIAQPFLAIWIVLFGAMQGAGYTRWTMWATCLAMLVFRLPLAWVLTVNMHIVPTGIWIAMASTVVLLGIVSIHEFRRGRWKLQKV
jgi:putative MATE family efflux protein